MYVCVCVCHCVCVCVCVCACVCVSDIIVGHIAIYKSEGGGGEFPITINRSITYIDRMILPYNHPRAQLATTLHAC